MVIISNINWSW